MLSTNKTISYKYSASICTARIPSAAWPMSNEYDDDSQQAPMHADATEKNISEGQKEK